MTWSGSTRPTRATTRVPASGWPPSTWPGCWPRWGSSRWSWNRIPSGPAWWPGSSGRDRERPALLVHGHLDVVPASAPDWRHDPFSGEIADGCVWGRGAIDMKDMDAMMLAVVRQRLRENRPPARDIVLTFTADEEAGGTWGARWLVDKPPGACSRASPRRSARSAASA